MPLGVVAWPGPASPPTQLTHMLMSAVALPGLAWLFPALALVFPTGSCGLIREFLKFLYQTYSQPWIPHMPAGAVALLGMVCPQSQSLHMLAGATAWVSLASSQPQLLPSVGFFQVSYVV